MTADREVVDLVHPHTVCTDAVGKAAADTHSRPGLLAGSGPRTHVPKWKVWALRYGPAEAFAAAFVVLVAGLVFQLTHRRTWAAFAGSATETAVYYTVIWLRDSHHPRSRRAAKLILEFLPPGILNACIVRPYLLYSMPLYIGHFTIGIIVGKLLADLCFYVFTIAMYEWTNRSREVATVQ